MRVRRRQRGSTSLQLPRAGIRLLLEAAEFAADSALEPWEFAIEVHALNQAGLSNNDLRWLICNKFLDLGLERIAAGKRRRHIIRISNQSLPTNACVILTKSGLATLSGLLHNRDGDLAVSLTESNASAVVTSSRNGDGAPEPGRPQWDIVTRELLFGDRLVKRFRVPAESQEEILNEFQRQSWPRCIVDPLKPSPGLDTKRRLSDAIRGLNSCHINRLIIFRGNGRGSGVQWESCR